MKFSCNHHAATFCREDASSDEKYILSEDRLGLAEDAYTFVYTYPLSRVARLREMLLPTTSIVDVLLLARNHYEQIYAAEEDSAGNPGHIPGTLNRMKSNGSYGIWGHDFSDLYFEEVSIDTEDKVITFGMGS